MLAIKNTLLKEENQIAYSLFLSFLRAILYICILISIVFDKNHPLGTIKGLALCQQRKS